MPKGPKPGLTPAVAERIAKEMSLGLTLSSAAVRCGVKPFNATAWYSRGKSGRGEPYASFYRLIEKAIADREQRLLGVIDAACRPDKMGRMNWQAAAWKLERMHPERWSRPAQRVVVEHDEDGIVVSKAAVVAMAMKAAQDVAKK